ncbi:MAG: KpsF/GutQ family sugar-phosphate isomerase [Candidatus Aminicenantes bacterium]|nr:KpsF/GutQ family sugar-phosphate isomerase [Candidatus Aminicenantes bacterium]
MKNSNIIEIGKEVLNIEAEALRSLASQIDDNFAKAVDLLASTKSRVIITGMGKSGLIGRKIAATLSSCGTPSVFIHTADAGHGDLGMIVEGDVMVIISYSGNTKEVIDLLHFVKRTGIKLIGITGNKNSKLAKYSDIVLDASVEREAEPSGLVPTASSTAALALGDALAISLMKLKGFGVKEFAFVHPKGQAGKRLLKVESLMHRGEQVPTVYMDTPMSSVVAVISQKKMGMTCVVDKGGVLVGIITDGDLRRNLQKHRNNLLQKKAADCMTRQPVTITKNDLATSALNIMEENKITSLIVKNKSGQIEGLIHLHDLWRTEML